MGNLAFYQDNLIKLFSEGVLKFEDIVFFQKQGFVFICEDGKLSRIERSDEYV